MSLRNFIFIFISILILFISLISIFGSDEVLKLLWNTPTMKPYFADVRHITGINETLSYGLDPLLTNPGDPWNRIMNYPAIWLSIAQIFQLNPNHSIYFGLLNNFLFITGFLIFVSKLEISRTNSIVLFLAFFSPATVLGMERGNIDLMLFFFFSLALLFISRAIIFSGIIVFSAILKLYPIFALVGLLKQNKTKFFKFSILSILIFSWYLITFDDIQFLHKTTPKPIGVAFGIDIVWKQAHQLFGSPFGRIFKYISYLYVLALFLFVYLYLKNKQSVFFKINKTYIDAFRIGSGMWIIQFLLTSSFDYRLIILIFSLPQLVLWMDSNNKVIKNVAKTAIILIIFTMWFLKLFHLGGSIILVFDEVSNWILFSSLTFLFAVSLPNWCLKYIKKK